MDNLCHSLVGMALSRAGLNKRTALATSTLVIANNLPDIDVGVFATNTLAMSFRRGWTHGVLAQLTLPIALTGAMLLYDRYPQEVRARPIAPSPAQIAAAVVHRRAAARVHGLHQQLRRAAADAVLRTLVLRRRALHRRSVALPDARAWAGGSAKRAARVRRASAWRWRAIYVAAMLASNVIARREVASGLARAGRRPTRASW